MTSGPVAAIAPENLLEMQILRSNVWAAESETGCGAQHFVLQQVLQVILMFHLDNTTRRSKPTDLLLEDVVCIELGVSILGIHICGSHRDRIDRSIHFISK